MNMPKLPAKARIRPIDCLGVTRTYSGVSSPSSGYSMSTIGPGRKSTSFSDTPTGPEPAAAVRRRERLVQVVMQHVEAQVARPGDADQRIHVCPIAVHQAAAVVHQLDD